VRAVVEHANGLGGLAAGGCGRKRVLELVRARLWQLVVHLAHEQATLSATLLGVWPVAQA